MVVPFPPGAASDFLARVLGQKLGEHWGQQIVVDNRPGAGGLIGGTVVAKSSPDGYTIALIGQPHLTATLLSRNPPWDPFKDFTHIGARRVDAERRGRRPGPAGQHAGRAAHAGEGEARALQLRLGRHRQLVASRGRDVQRGRGTQAVHVPFKLLGDALAEMYGGRVHYYLFPLPAAMPALRDGKLKAIATGGRARTIALPQVPTMAESGLPGLRVRDLFRDARARRHAEAIVTKINAETVKFLSTDEIRTRYQQNGADPMPSTPDEFHKIQVAEYARVKKVIQDIGLKPQF